MRNGKLDGVNAGEISFVHNVFAPRAIARFLSQNIGHGVGNGIKCRDHRQSQYPAAVLQFSPQRWVGKGKKHQPRILCNLIQYALKMHLGTHPRTEMADGFEIVELGRSEDPTSELQSIMRISS